MAEAPSREMHKIVTPEDIERVSVFADGVYHEYFVGSGLLQKDQCDYMVDLFLSPKAIAQSIDEGYEFYTLGPIDDPEGFVSFKCSDDDMFLSKLYASASSRGTGAGKFMMKFLSNLCVERGLGSIWLTCNRSNKPSLDFYDHMGFRIEGSEDNQIGNGYVMDDYILRVDCPIDVR